MAGAQDRKAAWTATCGVAVVAVTAAVISFSHVRRLALEAGEHQLASLLLPVSIDGAIVAAVAVILADSRAGRRPAGLTWLLLALGLAGSLAANIASAEPTLTARAVAAWPPVGLALGIEALAGMGRRRHLPVEVPAAAGNPVPAPRTANGVVASRANGRASSGTQAVRNQGGPADAETDAAAFGVIRQLDAAAASGRASRLEIQKRLGCGGSKAARLADLARRPTTLPAS